MSTSDTLAKLKARFNQSIISTSEAFGQWTAEVRKDELISILTYLKSSQEAGYEVLMDLTALDYLHPSPHTKILYFLHNPKSLDRLKVEITISRDEKVPSVTSLWEGADWYERELFDMFGVSFEGHPDLKRILMPDNWSGHPLRRDFSLKDVPVEFKHNVKPKKPSEIIPYVKFNEKT